MNAMSNIQTIVDIGFIALVTITCCRALMLSQTSRSEQDVQRRTDQWQAELQQVEGVLRRLVADATSAGQSLDRQLSRRHEELSALVRKIDQQKVDSSIRLDPTYLETATENAVAATSANELFDDLPNPSWHRNAKSDPPRETARTSPHAEINAKQQQNNASRSESPLTAMIEMENREETARPSGHEELIAQLPNALGVSMLTNPDIAAYKVAARLLSNGKEIHLVARKLGLPIHEVRALERLLRGQPAERFQSYETPAASTSALTPTPANNSALSTPNWTLGVEEEDLELENPIFSRNASLL